MPGLNTFHLALTHIGIQNELIEVTQSERILENKGLFIIPYDRFRRVAFVEMYTQILESPNETQTLYSNPPYGFYGYVHARRFKRPFGNPIAITVRGQLLYTWFSEQNIGIISERQTYKDWYTTIGASFPGRPWFLVPPAITDFSFGFARSGRVKAVVRIGYFRPEFFLDDPYGEPEQYVPNPEDVRNFDPSGINGLPGTIEPVTPPYVRPGDDFGESEPSDIPDEPPPEHTSFRFDWSYTYINRQNGQPDPRSGQSFTYEGTVISIGPARIAPSGTFVIHDVQTTTGMVEVGTANLSTSPEERAEQFANYQYQVVYF